MAFIKKVAKKVRDDQVKGAPKAMMQDLFDDYYEHRYEIYRMNFVRGIFVGFGGVIGATLMVTLLLWLLSLFTTVPIIGDFVKTVQHSVQQSQKK